MGKRRQARELALQALYLTDAGGMSPAEALNAVGAWSVDDKTAAFANDLVEGVFERRKALDKSIQTAAKNWELARMAVVDRNLLRMASFELLHAPETPVSVVIDEALEIAKTYSSQESSRFINGILDKIGGRGKGKPKTRKRKAPAKDKDAR